MSILARAGDFSGAPVDTQVGPDERITAHVRVVEQLLHRQLDELSRSWEEVDGHGAADDFVPGLPALVLDVLERGGKRTRPVMTYLGWIAGGGHEKKTGYADTVRAGAAIELLHAFALVHDDVMDESAVRRGRATVHEAAARRHAARHAVGSSARFGESVAILVGDLAHAEADAMAATLPPAMRRIWQGLALELVAGQHWDLVGSAGSDRSVPHARAVARQKTGNYTVARPLQLGAAAAGAGAATLDALARFGRHAGEAFALRDDLLGVFGDPRATGKPVGDDLRAGKPTVLLALASDAVRGPARDALAAAGSPTMSDAQVVTLQQAMIECGVVAEVERMVDERVDDAVAALDDTVLTSDGITELTRTVDVLARRRH